jgi:hypothetical protein
LAQDFSSSAGPGIGFCGVADDEAGRGRCGDGGQALAV